MTCISLTFPSGFPICVNVQFLIIDANVSDEAEEDEVLLEPFNASSVEIVDEAIFIVLFHVFAILAIADIRE